MARHSARGKLGVRVADVCAPLETIAPLALAQSWDNVGLLAGDRAATVARVMLCIDLTEAVVDEAIRRKAQFVMAYHPPLFKPISRLTLPSRGTEAHVFRCISAGIAICSLHTALDAAEGGTNDVIAAACGIKQARPLEYAGVGKDDRGTRAAAECKVVVFVPKDAVERVAAAIFTAGAGRIGDYEQCSFRLRGEGTFWGNEAANPVVGSKRRLERIPEVRLEAVAPTRTLPEIVAAIYAAHPYEEPAFDIYPLAPKPTIGIGRVGDLPKPITLGKLALQLKRFANAAAVQIVGPMTQIVRRAVIVAGAAGSLPFQAGLSPGDVVITGEVRHHDALAMLRCGAAAIALGHWTSERPVLASLAERLRTALPNVDVRVSTEDREPFGFVCRPP